MESSFDLLHPKVQQAVWQLGWTALHPIQEEAIPLVLNHTNDIIICAPTSGGKTEAVFLPLLSKILDAPARSFQVICIAPLKALINDQHLRLEALVRGMGIAVHRWHGDVDQHRKKTLRNQPGGILLITPESLESNFVNFGHQVPRLYRHLQYVVVDELHAFRDNERGIHLRSLLARLAHAIGHRPRSFGLSATLGDHYGAKVFVNAGAPDSVTLVEDTSTARPIRLSLVTCAHGAGLAAESHVSPEEEPDLSDPASSAGRDDPCPTMNPTEGSPSEEASATPTDTIAKIACDIQRHFGGSTNLVFANSRKTVELLGDHLNNQAQVLDDTETAFVLHHGSLSRQVRDETESALKSGRPTNALCTSSLELGIDVGAIAAVAQIDPTWTASSLVQRLGRSGRRQGQPTVLRLYVRSAVPNQDSSLDDLLFPKLLQSVAMLELLLAGWLEPPEWDRMHLSTLTHQILSMVKEAGGLTALELYEALCQRGPFRKVTPADFKHLLTSLCREQLIDQEPQGAIILGLIGEKVTSAPEFYAAFSTPRELSVRHGKRHIGKLPLNFGVKVGECLVLGAKRWLIEAIEWKSRTIWVQPTAIKKPPVFLGDGGVIHARVFAEMRRILRGTGGPAWLDAEGQELLRAARDTAERVGLTWTDVLEADKQVQWFPWAGTRGSLTLWLWARKQGLACSRGFLSLTYPHLTIAEFGHHLRALVEGDVNPVELAALLPTKRYERFDPFIDEQLLNKANATARLDVPAARKAAQDVLMDPNFGSDRSGAGRQQDRCTRLTMATLGQP